MNAVMNNVGQVRVAHKRWPDAMVRRAMGLRSLQLNYERIVLVLGQEFGETPSTHTVAGWCMGLTRYRLKPTEDDCREPEVMPPTEFDLAVHDEITDAPASCKELSLALRSNCARVLASLQLLMAMGWVEYANPGRQGRMHDMKLYVAARTKAA